jgi:hypothetical protein
MYTTVIAGTMRVGSMLARSCTGRARFGSLAGFAIVFSLAGAARAADEVRISEAQSYGFQAAAQEITQLFWLAETATACGWASEEDTLRFKHFTVRFLAAHLSGNYKVALISLVTENGYEDKVRRVAKEGAEHNCGNRRWHTGWVAYKAAADQHEQEF